MSKRLRAFMGLISTALGSGLVYATSSDLFSASADSSAIDGASPVMIVVLFIVGIILISFGVMVSLFIFASAPERK